MRWLLFLFLSAAAIADPPADTQENVVQEFSGSGSTTTGLFKVHDRWEVRWNARQLVSVAVMSEDGTIVAGAAGVLRGSLFVPLGGQYYLKISDGTVAPPAAVNATAPSADTNAAPATSTNAAPAANTNAAPVTSTNAAPVANTNTAPVTSTNTAPVVNTNAAPVINTNAPAAVAPTATDSTPPPEAVVSWHLQVVELGTSVASNQALTVYTPFFIVPDSAVTPVAPPPNLPPPVLTDEQVNALVTIKGDNAQGTGFLMRSPDGTFVVTHLHLLAANPNVTLLTRSGAPIKILSLKGAVDRDLAMFTIQDDHYSYLPLPAEAATSVEAGDPVIIPDIDQQTSDVLLGKPGRVIGLSPERIDFDNAIRPNSSGAPVIHVKSGNVLAVVTAVKKVDVSDTLAKAWAANPAPGSEGIIPCFGLRLTGVQGWETYDWPRFLAESLFLKQFHENTRCLDSYLNSALNSNKHHHGRDARKESGPPDDNYFLANTKLQEANETYKHLANGADQNQRLEAARELLFDLEGVADTGVSTLQGMSSLYAFDRIEAQEEMAYRSALKKELDDMGNHLVRLDNIARSR